MFRKNTGGLRDELYRCLTGEDTLEDFPCITYAEVEGYSEKLAKWLCTAPLLKTLRLKKAGVEVLDLGKAPLDYLELDMGGIRRLVLPGTIRSLSMHGEVHPEPLFRENRLVPFSEKSIPSQVRNGKGEDTGAWPG